MSDLVARIDAAIASLQEVRADAEKCEGGKTGAPGTRVRKAAQNVRISMGEVRKGVLDLRKQ